MESPCGADFALLCRGKSQAGPLGKTNQPIYTRPDSLSFPPHTDAIRGEEGQRRKKTQQQGLRMYSFNPTKYPYPVLYLQRCWSASLNYAGAVYWSYKVILLFQFPQNTKLTCTAQDLKEKKGWNISKRNIKQKSGAKAWACYRNLNTTLMSRTTFVWGKSRCSTEQSKRSDP